METITKSAQETFELGEKIGNLLTGGEVLALVGDLGSGKTTFIQGMAKALNIKTRILSPTFILMRRYQAKGASIKDLYHLDLYRLEEGMNTELKDLGIEDVWQKPDTLVVIEWAEKAKTLLPGETIWIEFNYLDDLSRSIRVPSFLMKQ